MTDKPNGTKEKLLALLESRGGTYVSGEEIAGELSISRTAIWKAVNALREMGCAIDAAPKRGYCLTGQTDVLSVQGIRKFAALEGLRLTVLPSVTSTNAAVRSLAEAGEPEGAVVLALEQTAGRGRLGRSFYSPADTGVYLSLLLRPQNFTPRETMGITTRAAVAAAAAVERLSGETAQIKWVNDILLNGKKVCGILTEAAFSMETGTPEYIIVGAGFNVCPPAEGFPEELRDIAGGILPTPLQDGKNRIAAAFLEEFQKLYHRKDISERYRRRCCVLGKPIWVVTPTGRRAATALDVDRQCRLRVCYADGTKETLASGEISIREAENQPAGMGNSEHGGLPEAESYTFDEK